jgi:hypothetical protein
MSTSDSVTLNKGPCPCGNGHIAQHVTTQDNPWSGADICYSIACDKCNDEWRLEGDTCTAVLRASEVEYTVAMRNQHSAYLSFTKDSEQLIEDYFASYPAKNKKMEHAEMERLNLTSMNYRQYLAHRRNGDSIASCCHGQRNKEWLFQQAAAYGKQREIEDLFNLYETTKNTASDAARLIVRRRVA